MAKSSVEAQTASATVAVAKRAVGDFATVVAEASTGTRTKKAADGVMADEQGLARVAVSVGVVRVGAVRR